MRPALPVSIVSVSLLLVLAAPSVATADETPTRAQTKEALSAAARALDGNDVTTGRELTPLLARLAAGRSTLSAADRRKARGLLARPTDGAADVFQNGYTVAEAAPYCTTNFCVHHVTSTVDAPDPVDGDADGVPDVVEATANELEAARAIENGSTALGWRLPVSDVAAGGDARTDAYLKDLGGGTPRIFGYAAIEDDGGTDNSFPAYLVLDNDFAPSQYGGRPAIDSRRATIAHEYNHVLQFAYDILGDLWQGESIATWAEERVFPGANDWNNYLTSWRACTFRPGLAAPGPATGACASKVYGSSIFNHFLAARYGPEVIRGAYERSVSSGSFAPGSYTNALPQATNFPADFIAFAAASAEWKQQRYGLPDAQCGTFPNVARASIPLTSGGSSQSVRLDHTGYQLYTVTPGSNATNARLSATAPAGVDTAVALVARTGTTVTTAIRRDSNGGTTNVALPNPGQYDAITAVVVNASIDIPAAPADQYDNTIDDWAWTQDNELYTNIAITDAAGNAGSPDTIAATGSTACTRGIDTVVAVPGAPRPAPSGGSGGTATLPTTPGRPPATGATPTPALTFRLSATARQKRSTVLKRGVTLKLRCNRACSARATLSLSRASARRLKLSRTLGTASTRLSKAGAKTVRVKLGRKARARLRKTRRLTVTLTLRTKASTGAAKTTTRKITIVR